ncbi:MAG TPA: hypothetical protein VNW46_08520 [Gemmatimonadaceae bacterium]|jgi:hypothetical protein|nr:hypothetical protein [Gemmatimonadaceae bacterium]
MWHHAGIGLAVAVVMAGAIACTHDLGPPAGSQQFTPPARYKAWWRLTESCSGLTGDFSKVRWYRVPNSDSFSLEGSAVNGAWYADGNRIALGDSEMNNGALVRHEMLHALMQSGGHPRSQFLGNCSDIVVCVDRCVHDARGAPDTSDAAPLLGGFAFQLVTRIAPDTVSLSADSGLFSVSIEITNITSTPGRIRVPVDSLTPYTQILCIYPSDWPESEGALTDLLPYYETVAPAGTAGATRRVVFDTYAERGSTSLPHAFTFSGMFAGHQAPPRTLVVVP